MSTYDPEGMGFDGRVSGHVSLAVALKATVGRHKIPSRSDG